MLTAKKVDFITINVNELPNCSLFGNRLYEKIKKVTLNIFKLNF